jgi:hypothetical protein
VASCAFTSPRQGWRLAQKARVLYLLDEKVRHVGARDRPGGPVARIEQQAIGSRPRPAVSRLLRLDHAPKCEIDTAVDSRRRLRHSMQPEALRLACHYEPMALLQFKRDCFLRPPVSELKPPHSTERLGIAERAVAAWFSSGLDFRYQRLVGPGSLSHRR